MKSFCVAKPQMKILIYGFYFLPTIGGVQTLIDSLAEGLAGLNPAETGSDGTRIEVAVATPTPANGMDDSALPYSVVRQPGIWRLAELIREASVVHVAGPAFLPMAIAWLTRTPFVVEHHGYQAICPNGLLFVQPSQTVCSGHFMKKQYGTCIRCCSKTIGFYGGVRSTLLTFPRRWLCKRAAANIAVSNHVAARVALPHGSTVYHGIKAAKPGTIPNASSDPSIAQVAYLGRLVAEKGLPLLLDAARHLKDSGLIVNVMFIGDGPERRNLTELAVRLHLSDTVAFTGDLRGAELERAVTSVPIVVMPSVWEETAGLSAIEQMMRGRVVIVADIGGLSEVVGDSGLKFPPGDALALASCIRRVIQNPSLAASLGSAARERAIQLFGPDSMIERHLTLYREALSR